MQLGLTGVKRGSGLAKPELLLHAHRTSNTKVLPYSWQHSYPRLHTVPPIDHCRLLTPVIR